MPQIHWRGCGPDYELSWFGSNWQLRLDGPRPSLELAGEGGASLLALDGLAARGRSAAWKSERPTPSKFDALFDRVEAFYSFPSWGGLSLRASWSLVPEIDGVDLEIQVLADSVDLLKGLEVQIVTELRDPRRNPTALHPMDLVVEPRDREAAGLSYDGRESGDVLRALTTLPVPPRIGSGFEPKVIETPWLGEGVRYVEFVHPEDVARRISRRAAISKDPTPGEATLRYGLFGHDLEKGVLLRSRMRAIWRKGIIAPAELDTLFRDFRESPLPLGP